LPAPDDRLAISAQLAAYFATVRLAEPERCYRPGRSSEQPLCSVR